MVVSRNSLFTDPVLAAVSDCLGRFVRAGQNIVVAYSGGLDSAVLLHAVSRVAGDIRLTALHINHGLSPHADEWEALCVENCMALEIEFAAVSVVVPRNTGKGIEAAARRLRHQALLEYPADWVLLAHHADDQAETLLHNLLRGTGVRGAAAMPDAIGNTLRPFLGLGRAAIKSYADAHEITWIEDESNSDCRYTRNYLRAKITPILQARFPQANEHLAAAARRFGEAQALLDELAKVDLQGNPPQFPVPVHLLREASTVRARNLLRSLLAWCRVQAPDEVRLNEFVRQLREAGCDRHPRLDVAEYSLWYAKGLLHFQSNIS